MSPQGDYFMDKQQVLIIDDDIDTARFFHLVFDLLGFSCLTLNTAEDAIAALEITRPDMILLDLRLGTSTGGEEILYRVRADERFDHTRVIIVTAYPVLAKAVADLADLVLVKPVDVDQLKQLTSRLLGVEVRPRQYFYHDPMTGLFNKDFFLTRLDHAFERARRRSDFRYAVLALQGKVESADPIAKRTVVLKPVYQQFAERLRKSYRPTDTVAYLENGQFASLHEELRDSEDLGTLVARMKNILSEPFTVGPAQYFMAAQIGAALNESIFCRPDDILIHAQRAMTLEAFYYPNRPVISALPPDPGPSTPS